jgi:hypothetical protein
MDELEEKARKESERVDKIIANLEVIDEKANSLLSVLNSYYKDCKGFLEKRQFLQALETAFICWAYVDAGLHLKVFKVPEEMRKIFTVE